MICPLVGLLVLAQTYIPPEKAAVVAPGKPLGPTAMVQAPPPLKDAISWTWDTRRARGPIAGAAISRDGKSLATAGSDGTVRVYDVKTGELRRALVGHSYGVTSVTWSPDDKFLLTGGGPDGTARIWEEATGRPIRLMKGHKGAVNLVAWSPDGESVATAGGTSGFVSLWDVGKPKAVRTVETGGVVAALAWSPDSKRVAVAGKQISVRAYDLREGEAARDFAVPDKDGKSVAWSADAKYVFGSGGRKSFLWDAESGKALHEWPGESYTAAFTRDGAKLALALPGAIAVYATADPKAKPVLVPYGTAPAIAWTPEGELILGSGYDVSRWKPGEAEAAMRYDVAATTQPSYAPGRPLVTGIGEATPSLWSTTTGKLLAKLEGHKAAVYQAAWSADGKTLATASGDKTLRLWGADGTSQRTLKGHAKEVYRVVWTGDKTLASGGLDGEVRLWKSTADEGKVLWKHKGHVTTLAWSKATKQLASGGYDHAITVGGVDGGKPKSFELEDSVQGLTWAPGGKGLATSDGTAWKLWNGGKSQPLAPLPPWIVPGSREGYRTVGVADAYLAPVRATIIVEADQLAIVSAAGHYRVPDEAKTELVAVVQTSRGQETLTPEAFAKKYKWKNTPALVKLTGK